VAIRPGNPEAGHRSESLMGADRIRRLWDNEALYLVANEEPALITTRPFYKSPTFRKVKQFGSVEIPRKNELPLFYVPFHK